MARQRRIALQRINENANDPMFLAIRSMRRHLAIERLNNDEDDDDITFNFARKFRNSQHIYSLTADGHFLSAEQKIRT